MSSSARLPLIVGTAVGGAALVALVFALTRGGDSPRAAPVPETVVSARPKLPPGPNDPRPKVVEPKSPRLTDEWRAEISRKVVGLAQPGEAAFNAYADLFFDENLAMAQEQAAREGLTLPEVRALTRFGLLVMTTQRIPEVEDVLGRELSAETQQALGELVFGLNAEFKDKMRALVAKNAPEAERWQLISATDQVFRERYLAATGMTAEQLDDLLAGNLLLPDSPPAVPGEEPVGAGKRDTIAAPPRPTGAAPPAR